MQFRFLLISDTAGKALDIPRDVVDDAAFVLHAGDVTLGAKHDHTFTRAFQKLGSIFPPPKNVYYIPGNHDSPALATPGWGPDNFILVHDAISTIQGGSLPNVDDDVTIIGFGGATLGLYNNFAFSDEEIFTRLDSLFTRFEARQEESGRKNLTILLVHDPPADSTLDFTFQKTHVGSRSVRLIIEKYQPDIVVAGHIHESPGVDRIGRALCVNAGEAKSGRYAIISVNGGIIEAQLCQA